jgi:hypothetical protein
MWFKLYFSTIPLPFQSSLSQAMVWQYRPKSPDCQCLTGQTLPAIIKACYFWLTSIFGWLPASQAAQHKQPHLCFDSQWPRTKIPLEHHVSGAGSWPWSQGSFWIAGIWILAGWASSFQNTLFKFILSPTALLQAELTLKATFHPFVCLFPLFPIQLEQRGL